MTCIRLLEISLQSHKNVVAIIKENISVQINRELFSCNIFNGKYNDTFLMFLLKTLVVDTR